MQNVDKYILRNRLLIKIKAIPLHEIFKIIPFNKYKL